MAIVVRPATARDARRIAEIHVRSWQVGYRGLLPDAVLDGLSAENRETWWRRWLTSPPSPRFRALMAELGGSVSGFATLGETRDEDEEAAPVGEIYAIYVDPDLCRQGVGAALMERAEAELHALGFTEATLWGQTPTRRAGKCRDASSTIGPAQRHIRQVDRNAGVAPV
jgi:GNAT superfamily N-acetyltransferase